MGELSDRIGIVERQRAIDRGNDLFPVAQHVERHHRRYEQQAEEVDQCHATLGHLPGDDSRPRQRLARPLCGLRLEILETGRVQAEFQQQRLDHGLNPHRCLDDILRCFGDQSLHLAEKRRQNRHRDRDSQQHGHDGHRGGGHRAGKPKPL